MTATVERIVMAMLGLILVYLLLANSRSFSNIMNAAGSNSVSLFRTLQGRSVPGK